MRPSLKVFTNPVRLFIIIIAAIFIAEGVVMLTLSLLPPLSLYTEAVVDSLLLIIISFPMLYLLLLKPFKAYVEERKKAELERERLIGELQDALRNIKTLTGLLPICASCKRIRDDKGYWNRIEKYIEDHSDAMLSHGICPECMKRLYPEVDIGPGKAIGS